MTDSIPFRRYAQTNQSRSQAVPAIDCVSRIGVSLLVAIVAMLATASPGLADVQIDYDLSGSRLTTFAGLVELTPTAGGPEAAFARITLSGDVANPAEGPAIVEDFVLADLPINENLFDVVSIQGNAQAVQVGSAQATLSGQEIQVSAAHPLAIATAGDVVCTPSSYCDAVGQFPIEFAGVQAFSPVSFQVRRLHREGRSSLFGQIELEFEGQHATLDLVGVETDRRDAPEPAATLQLAAGVLALLGIGRRGASRRGTGAQVSARSANRGTRGRRGRALALVMLALPLLQAGCEVEVHTIPIHVIALADDDGGRANQIGQGQIASHVAFANTLYEPAGVQFSFDPATDWETRNDTTLNSMQNEGSNWWVLPNSVAARYPGKIVIFLRFGPDTSPTPTPAGNGFAYPPDTGQTIPPSVGLPTDNVDFIAMPNWMLALWPNNQGFLAHEIGHYLGLFHTQPTWGGDTNTIQGILDAEGLAGLDGDGLSDTPPDAGDNHFLSNTLWMNQCDGQDGYVAQSAFEGGAVTITPDRGNVMGYFWCQPMSFSGQQILILRKTLQHDVRRHLIEPVCSPDHHRFPADQFQRCFDYWVPRGWWPVSVSSTQNPGGVFPPPSTGEVTMTSSFQPGTPRWVRHLATSGAFQSAFDDALAGGQRPDQVQGIQVDGETRWNGVWAPIDGQFESYSSMTESFFGSKWGEMGERGWQLVDFNVHDHEGHFRFAATWVDRPHNGYVAHYEMDEVTYDNLFDYYGALGWEVVRFSTYRNHGVKRYAALWHPAQGPYVHHPWQTPAEHQANYDALYVQGYRLRQLHDYDGLISAIWTLPNAGVVTNPAIFGSVGIGTSTTVTSPRTPPSAGSITVGEGSTTGGGVAAGPAGSAGNLGPIGAAGSGLVRRSNP